MTLDVSCVTRDKVTVTLGVIADDITGALDTGVQFAKAGLETALLLFADDHPSLAREPGQVHVRSTDSRDMDAATARRQAVQAAGQLRGRWLYKKIDSTMRGHVGVEIEAILRTAKLSRAVVCPAVLSQRRTIREGALYVGDAPLHVSEFAHDPVWPARTSSVVTLLGLPATHLALEVVRSGPRRLAQAILGAPTEIVAVDAVEAADVDCVARAAVLGRCLPCGALGLAGAWIECLIAAGLVCPEGQGASQGLERSIDPVLIVAGSRHPTTRDQLHHAAAALGLVVVEVPTRDEGEEPQAWSAIAAAMAERRSVIVRSPAREIRHASERWAVSERMAGWTLRVCRDHALAGLVLTGGETALAACRALEATAIDIAGELEAGIPWGRLVGGIVPGLPVVTKAGGFGGPDSLLNVLHALQLGPDREHNPEKSAIGVK